MGVAFPFALPANGIESSNQFFLVFRDGFLMAELELFLGFFRWPLSLLEIFVLLRILCGGGLPTLKWKEEGFFLVFLERLFHRGTVQKLRHYYIRYFLYQNSKLKKITVQ
jgi:hypothetical protein